MLDYVVKFRSNMG